MNSVIKKDIKEVSLGEICEFKYGKSLPAPVRLNGNVPVYGSNGIVGYHNEALTDGITIVIGRKGSCGEVNFSQASCFPIDTTYFIDRSATNADLRWLAYQLSYLGLTNLNKAAAVPGLNREDAYRKRLLLPPIAQQKHIAAILDQAEALRSQRRKAIALLDELARSVFLEMFGDPAKNPKGWAIGTIRDLLESASYGTSEKSGAEGTFPVLRMNNLTYSGEISCTDLKFMNLKPEEEERYLVRKGDVLFNRTNSAELVGKTAIYRSSEKMAYAGYLVRLRANEDNHPEFISSFLNSNYAKRMLRGMCKSIVTAQA